MQRCLQVFFTLFLPFISFAEEAAAPTVLVTIAPYRYLVNELTGSQIQTVTLVPPAANMHTFEPSPKQADLASHAALWLKVGEPFEEKVQPALLYVNKEMDILDLREGIDLITSSCCQEKSHADLHYWLDPVILQFQVKRIAEKLKKHFPSLVPTIENNEKNLLERLEHLHSFIREETLQATHKAFLVSHPSFSYFAKRYDLIQYSVEMQGRDPTPKQLTELIETTQNLQLKIVIIQPQFNNKGARLIARHLSLTPVIIDPYSEKFLDSLKTLAETLQKS